MRIPNKFNGYSADNRRLYNDPMTIAGVLGTGEGLLGTGIAASTVGGLGALETGLTAGSMLAGGAEGLAGIFSNPAMAMAGIPESAATTAATQAIPEAVSQATAFNTATNQAIQNELQKQAAQQAAQNALGYQAFTPATAAQNQVLDMFRQAQLNPTDLSQFPQYTPEASGAAPQLVEKAAEAYNPQPIADFSRYTGQTFLPEGMGYQDVVKAVPGGSMDAGIQAGSYVSPITKGGNALSNLLSLARNPSMQGVQDYVSEHPYATGMGAYALYNALKGQPKQPVPNPGMIRPYTLTRTQNQAAYAPSPSSAERRYFTDTYTAGTPYTAPGPGYMDGGIVALGVGGPVEAMSAMNAVGNNQMYPQSQLQTADYSNPMVQRPMPTNVVTSGVDTPVDTYTGEQKLAGGGLSDLGAYSDGGRLLKGPGDGVSDSIPAVIGGKQPARLADGEFVVPARIVSELGNGSTEAGARKLYSMMDRVQKARGKTTGKDRVAADTKTDKYLPA